jgi:hypothetical protein
MTVREYFQKQLDEATAITIEQIEEMRATRRARMTDGEYANFMATSRLGTAELVGKRMAFYMLRAEGKLEVLRIIDDELDQLSTLRFERMSNAYPIFGEVV